MGYKKEKFVVSCDVIFDEDSTIDDANTVEVKVENHKTDTNNSNDNEIFSHTDDASGSSDSGEYSCSEYVPPEILSQSDLPQPLRRDNRQRKPPSA